MNKLASSNELVKHTSSFDAFYKAADELPKDIKGVSRVWYGKLATPFESDGAVREYGVCMEMDDAAARARYGNDPAHEQWDKAYSKVRVEGTTTFDVVGQCRQLEPSQKVGEPFG